MGRNCSSARTACATSRKRLSVSNTSANGPERPCFFPPKPQRFFGSHNLQLRTWKDMPNKKSKGVCLVIGAGDGVGSAIAKAFALDGFQTVITRRARKLEQPEVTAQDIRARGGVVHAKGVDARSEEETIALFAEIERDIGPIEVVVFNIGANVRFGIEE